MRQSLAQLGLLSHAESPGDEATERIRGFSTLDDRPINTGADELNRSYVDISNKND